MRRKSRLAVVTLIGALALAGCGGESESSGSPSNPSAASSNEPTPDEVERCLLAWIEEDRAVKAGTLDDATLRATATECPDYETWEAMRELVGTSGSPNTLRALCTFVPDSPVCSDPNRPPT